VRVLPLPAARLTTARAAAASARAARRLGAVEAVIIWPTISAPRRSRNPGLRSWRHGLDTALRGSYLTARAVGLALVARGDGRLLLVVDAAADGDVIGAVLADALSALADGLRKALGPAIDVAQLRAPPRRRRRAAPPDDRRIAALVRSWLDAPPGAATTILS